MTPHGRKKILLAIHAVLAAAIVGSVALAVQSVDLAAAPQPAGPRSPKAASSHPRPPRTIDDYPALCQGKLRLPLYDPPPTMAAVATRPLGGSTLRLIGTVIERGFPYAMFRLPTGDVKAVGVGEAVEGMVVLAIDKASATVRSGGKVSTIPVEKEEPKR